MTENELWALTPEQRRALPRHVVDAALLTTLEEARELLTLEGWVFVAVDDRYKDEPDSPDSLGWPDPEVWRRQVGGRVEWCDLHYFPPAPELPPEQCWCRGFTTIDPRLITCD